MTILTLLVMSVGGRIGAWLAGLLSQPSVLGELLIGVALGATPWFVGADADPAISLVAQAGAVLLLFEAGIECDMASLVSVARSSLLVAITGVVASMAAGFAASLYFQPTAPWITHWFVAGILCSTGAGVTARVLKDLGKTQSTEGHVILGAAVIDDVLGLLVMAVLLALASGSTSDVYWTALKVAIFLVAAGIGGRKLAPQLGGKPLWMCLLFCAAFAWLASLAGLAPIIGGFAAGLLLDRDGSPVESLRPLNAVLVPLFFVAMGMKADLRAVSGLTFGLLLVVAAILGKLACGLGVLDKNCNRWAVSAGMIPRAEVALIFAGAGLQSQILDKSVFSAVVLVVIVTTLLAPLGLKLAFQPTSAARSR